MLYRWLRHGKEGHLFGRAIPMQFGGDSNNAFVDVRGQIEGESPQFPTLTNK